MKKVKSKATERWSVETSPVPLRPYKFPKDFVFGAATSAYQIEGGIDTSTGRGRSIWEPYFEKRPGSDTGEIACDHYNQMPQDVQLFKKMGLQAYRFSVAWPRVLPDGVGKVNDKGLDFYKRLVDELQAVGITPYLTGYHWDLPQALEELGGWTNRDTAKRFGDYMEILARSLGDRVQHWGTLNEPAVIVSGYTSEGLAPGRNDPKLWSPVVHNLMLAHGYGARAIRAVNPELTVGCTVNLVPIEPANPSARHAARRLWQRDYAVFLDAMLKGEYPEIVLKEMETNGLEILPGDMELIVGSGLDYLGVNWYLRLVVNRLRACR
jgi:beta-glucosidase